jgi:putative chitinase
MSLIITPERFKILFPSAHPASLPAIQASLEEFEINTPRRVAMFLTQIGVEYQGFTKFQENLNYRADRIVEVFKVPLAEARKYEHNPQALANRFYSNRNGNGPASTGDGWAYRGHGMIHLTFKDNYKAAGHDLNLPLVEMPDKAAVQVNAARIAAWYFTTFRSCLGAADAGNVVLATKLVNGGTNGLTDRQKLYSRCAKEFGC